MKKVKQAEEILNVLEEKTIHDYISKYYELQNKIEDMLGKLKNCGVKCDCDDVNTFTINIDNDTFQDIQKICINCGGWIDITW